MTYTSDRPISVDGVRLDTLAWNIEKINRATAGRRTADVVVPGRDGAIPSLNDDLEPLSFGLEMFIMGTDPDGVVPPEGRRGRFRANLDELVHLFGKRHALLEVQEQTGPGSPVANLSPHLGADTPGAPGEVMRNYVRNPRLGVDASNWNHTAGTGGVATGERVPDGGPNDWAYYRATWTTASASGNRRIMQGAVTGFVFPGNIYTFSCYVRTNVARPISAVVDQAAGGTWVKIDSNFQDIPANQWTRIHVTGTIQPNVTSLQPMIQAGGGTLAVGDVMESTGWQLTRTAYPVDYFDGTTRLGEWAVAEFQSVWVGTPHSAESRVEGEVVTEVQGGDKIAVTRSPQWSDLGAHSYRLTPRILGALNPTASQDAYARINLLAAGCEEGHTYTVRAVARQAAPLLGSSVGASQGRNLFVDITGGGAGTRAFGFDSPHPNQEGVFVHTLTFTVPKVDGSPVTQLNLRLYHGHPHGSGSMWWDSISVIEGVNPGPFFTGWEAPTEQHTYARVGGSAYRYPAARRAMAKVQDAITPDVAATGGSGQFTVGLTIPAGVWEDARLTDWDSGPIQANQPVEVTSLRGGTERVTDAVVLLQGPITSPQIADAATGAYVRLNKALAAGECWRVNVATWSSRTGNGLTLDGPDAAGADAQHLTQFGGTPNQAAFLPLVPVRDPVSSTPVGAAQDGTPYVTSQAGNGTVIGYDDDGVPYVTALAEQASQAVAYDTDQVPYLTGGGATLGGGNTRRTRVVVAGSGTTANTRLFIRARRKFAL